MSATKKIGDISESNRVKAKMTQDTKCPNFSPGKQCTFCGGTGVVSQRKLENMGSFDENCQAKKG